MNQINGYTQIELPDRIALEALKTAGVTLTDAEAKPIIKALNLDQVKGDEVYSSYMNAWLNKPVIVSAYVPMDEGSQDVKSIFHASIISVLSLSDNVKIVFAYEHGDDYKMIKIEINAEGADPGLPMRWRIVVSAVSITTTSIA